MIANITGVFEKAGRLSKLFYTRSQLFVRKTALNVFNIYAENAERGGSCKQSLSCATYRSMPLVKLDGNQKNKKP